MKKRWSKKIIITMIRDLHSAGEKLNAGYVQKHQNRLFMAARNHFGSWKKAVEAAGIDYQDVCTYHVWDKETICQTILDLYSAGEKLNSGHVHKHQNRLAMAARNHFGSWKKAVEAAGIDYDEVCGWWTEERIINEIQLLANHGMQLNPVAIERLRGDLIGAARRKFGSWSRALEVAGIDYLEQYLVWSSKAWFRSSQREKMSDIGKRAKRLARTMRTIPQQPAK